MLDKEAIAAAIAICAAFFCLGYATARLTDSLLPIWIAVGVILIAQAVNENKKK